MLQKLMLWLIVTTLGLTGAATADVVDKLTGKTLIVGFNLPCTNSDKATRKTWHVKEENAAYVATGRRLFLFWTETADRGIIFVVDGLSHTGTTIRSYNHVPQSMPISTRVTTKQDSLNLSYDLKYTGKWPNGQKLVNRESSSGRMVIGSDGRTCRLTNVRYAVYLQDGDEVLDDYHCEAASLDCSIVDGLRTGG